jgi:hypothetical protein
VNYRIPAAKTVFDIANKVITKAFTKPPSQMEPVFCEVFNKNPGPFQRIENHDRMVLKEKLISEDNFRISLIISNFSRRKQ